MDRDESKKQEERITRFKQLEVLEKKIQDDLALLDTISGNASAVQRVVELRITRPHGEDILLTSSVLSDYTVRSVLEPLLNEKLDEVWNAQEKI